MTDCDCDYWHSEHRFYCATNFTTPAPVTGETTDAGEGEGATSGTIAGHVMACHTKRGRDDWRCACPATPDADDASEPTDEWPLGDQNGYDVALCVCEGGAYLGARQMGQPCCCEQCGRLTRDQWDHLVSAAATRAADDRAERIAQAIEAACAKAEMLTQEAMGVRSQHWRGPDYADGLDCGIETTTALVREAIARTTP